MRAIGLPCVTVASSATKTRTTPPTGAGTSAETSSTCTSASSFELPKVVKKKARTLTPAEYAAILDALPQRHRLMVETAINTGLRWGELIALKPHHLDLATRKLSVEETIVEVSTKNSPTGQRMLTKPYPKDSEPHTLGLPSDLVGQLADWITDRRLRSGDLLFATREGTPLSRNTFRTRVWRSAVAASGVARGRVRPQERDGPDGPRPDHHHPEVPPHPSRRRPEEPHRPRPDPQTCPPGRHRSLPAKQADRPSPGLPRGGLSAPPGRGTGPVLDQPRETPNDIGNWRPTAMESLADFLTLAGSSSAPAGANGHKARHYRSCQPSELRLGLLPDFVCGDAGGELDEFEPAAF